MTFSPSIRKKRGITLFETVIALTVIGIVLVATATLMLASVRSESRALDELHLAATAENAVECFRYAEDADELYEALLVCDPDFTRTGEDFSLKRGSCRITVTADFSANTVTVRAVDANGKELHHLSFDGGAG